MAVLPTPAADSARERRIHAVFVVSVLLKAFNAALEILLGTALLFTTRVNDLVLFLVHGELIEDPTDFLATHIRDFLRGLTFSSELYGAFYLLSHGVIKLFLVWGLLRDRLWAYPASMVFLGLFIVYQSYKFVVGHSWFMLALTVFDLFVLVLVAHEYRILKARRQAAVS